MSESQTPGGARFIKADLHIHTPESYDYQDDEAEPSDLIERFVEENIELVAITDHNTDGYYEELVEAAEAEPVTVLPGVEITTGQSGENQIHMTAIFPPDNAPAISGVMHEIGLGTDPETAIADATIPSICDTVREAGGLPILAHIDQNAGAHHELANRNNPTRQRTFDSDKVAALEIVSLDTADQFPEFAHIRSSDAHNLDSIGERCTYLKMDAPTFEGFRMALSDPESRVSVRRQLNTHMSIDSLQVENGFLEPRKLQFNKNLNSLIGGKGTGKSSVLEHIRYALDIEPRSEDIAAECAALIKWTLAPDGIIRLRLTGNTGDQYEIVREYNSAPVIYRVSDDESTAEEPLSIPIDRFRQEFFDAEIHSQRELINLARNETNQLELLDTYFDLAELKRDREETKAEIKDQSLQVQTLQNEVDQLIDKTHHYETLREQIEVMSEKGVDEYVEGQEEWEEERASLATAIEGVEEVDEKVGSMDLTDVINEISPTSGPNQELLEDANSIVENLRADIEELQESLKETVAEAQSEISEVREEWNRVNKKREREHSRLADEIHEEIDVDVDQFFEIRSEMHELRGVSEELETMRKELEKAKTQKDELFGDLAEARRALTEARQDGISALNGELNDVRVSLESQANRIEYIDWINHVLEGSGVYTRHKEAIAKTFEPRTLAEIVRTDDIDRLTEVADCPPTSAENFITHDDLNERLTELELLEVRDEPIFELNDGGWKSLDEMSDGQQCTTLLSITMIERDVPLIIDQPEDMLDNKFIFSEVVQLVRSIKHDRQIITATHNANIPVLGDAEQIIVMDANGQSGFYSTCGSIDNENVKMNTQSILEGGEQAFRDRNDKYRRSI
ncbi:TrlF family AAA-like ATPase [Halalkalicoccus subterraneus]|uniref:TrlF family AAA-like ATPase n=1 Tax=Halalkalicoccus subterraneus TaxID=2675002 RepID=UPI000EFB1D4E|nr:AAA family ATPase [Halalkalicoccus subterraneus]